jgi:hypothetical protein
VIDPRDYIDWDEGRPERIDPREAFHAEGEPCENCGVPCERRTWVPGFEYWGCDDCVTEAQIMVFAEANCPTLFDAIMKASRVSEVQAAFRQHKESCPHCNPALKPAPTPIRETVATPAGIEHKEAA